MFTDFWGSTVRTTRWRSPHLPSDPAIDQTGTLPAGAYVSSSNSTMNKVCRVSLAISLGRQRTGGEDVDPDQMVQTMQSFVEDGLSSFQLEAVSSPQHVVAWKEEQLYRRFLQESPGTIRRQAHLTVPLQLPYGPDAVVNRQTIRAKLSGSLLRMGSPETLDCVLLDPGPYKLSDDYVMDTMDILEDLKREGLLLAVTGRNLSPFVLRSLSDYGVSVLQRNQRDMNAANTSNVESILFEHPGTLPLQATAPLFGGLLTDRFIDREFIPLSNELSINAQRYMRERFPTTKANSAVEWRKFQKRELATLRDIARKHGVSTATVAVRSLLQNEQIDSVAVCTKLSGVDSAGSRRESRKQQFRDVFRFELEEDDMERLWKYSAWVL